MKSTQALSPLSKKRLQAARGFLYPLLVYLFLVTMFPGLYSLWISFTDFQLNGDRDASFVGFANYAAMFSDNSLFFISLQKTALFVVVALPIQFLLGYLIAKIFAATNDMRGAVFLRTLYLLPVMITPLSVGLFWSYLLNPSVGVLNAVLGMLRLPSQAWLSDPSASLFAIMAIYIWQWTPFAAMLILAGLLAISPEIYESADVDGARWWDRVWAIDLPLLKKVLGVACILSIVQIINTFDLILATTNGGPGTSTLVSAYAVYRDAFHYFQTGRGAAESIVIMAITVFLSQTLARYLLKEEGER